MKGVFILNIMMIISRFIYAQEQLSKKQQADLLFNRYEYVNASILYANLADKKHPDVKIVERLAMCYRKMNDYEAAGRWYAIAAANPKAEPITHFYYAEVLLTNTQFEQAKAAYKRYEGIVKNLNDRTGGAAQILNVKIASCDSAAVWINQESRFKLNNARGLNTSYADWGLSYFGKTGLVFTSERPTDGLQKYNDIYKWTGNPWLKLFQATTAEFVTHELAVVRKEHSAFVTDYHVGPMVVNGTADTAYVTIATRAYASSLPVDKKENKQSERLYTRRLELIVVVKSDGRWRYSKAFPYNNVKAYSLGNAALTKNGKVLYFTSDMPGGMGETDIWYSEKRADGSWSNPVNCGPEINTAEEESFPTIGPKGELYFSSKGKVGMGGYDVYWSKGEKAAWTSPVNLKYPVNTTYDDFYFSTVDGLSGYLSSNRKGGMGDDDIYSFVYRADEVVKPQPEKPLPQERGKYEVGKTYVLRNVYYNFDQSDIRPDAAAELDKLVMILNEHPDMQIELGSHTDSRSNDSYNVKLSQARANAVVAYLIRKGIAKNRLEAKGYGETMLLNSCGNGVNCSDAEHQANRRTEFKVKNNHSPL